MQHKSALRKHTCRQGIEPCEACWEAEQARIDDTLDADERWQADRQEPPDDR